MGFRNILKEIPIYPLSAFIFYAGVVIFWNIGIIPPPKELVIFLEGLYGQYGLIGLFIAVLLEGLAYVGLYFPGTTIIALGFIFSGGNFTSLFFLILVATLALTIDSIINYWVGRYFRYKKNKEVKKKSTERGLFLSVLHPDLLAFYFFHRGLKKKSFWRVFIVPIPLIIYGLLIAFAFSLFTGFIKENLVANIYFIFSAIIIWGILTFISDHKIEFKQGIKRIYKYYFH